MKSLRIYAACFSLAAIALAGGGAALAAENPQTIMDHIQKDGKYTFTIDGKDVDITKDMLFVERQAAHNYQLSELKDGYVLLNTERDLELEAEGFAREVMRNVQDLRKKAGMQKTDDIVLYLKVSKVMNEMLTPLRNDIAAKVGAHVFELVDAVPGRKYTYNENFKVKDEEFTAYFEKL